METENKQPENIDQLKKLAKVFNADNIITSDEINQVLEGIASILLSYKQSTTALNDETRSMLNSILEDVKKAHIDGAAEIETKKGESSVVFDEKISEIKKLIDDVKALKQKIPERGLPGKDADEKKITEQVISTVMKQIKLPEYAPFVMTGENVVASINALDINDPDLQIDWKHIKNVPKNFGSTSNQWVGSPIRYFSQMEDFDGTTAPTNGQVPVWNSTTKKWTPGAGGGGGSGTPGGSDTQLQYNQAGAFGGITGATTDGTTVTLTSPNITTAILPTSNDGAPLGSNAKQFSDLFLASGGVIAFNASAVTITHGANKLTFQGGSSGYQFDSLIAPNSNDGAPLGSTTLNWSDLFLATGAVINFNAGNVLLTHSAGILTMGTGEMRITTPGTNAASVITQGSTNALTNKTLTSSTNVLGGVTMTLGSDADGDIYYRSGGVLTRLAKGTSLQQLRMNVGATAPEWFTASGGGSGTVTNTGGNLTANSVVLGAGTVDTKVVAGITTDGASQLNLGVNATTLGKLKMFGNTSGDVTIQPAAAAGTATVLTLPASTDTLVGRATTDTMTSKTLTSPVLTTPVLGTPSSGTLTNCTGLPISGLVNSTSTALGVGSLNVGHATDTTIGRVSAGVISVEGVTIPSVSSTDTLSNKRITKRTGTTTSSATPTINTDTVDFYSITALTVDITSMTTNLSGTPTEGQTLWIAITGTAARAITWGSSFEASTIALPTTTVTTNRLDVGFVWNTVTSKWRCVATC